MKLLHAWRDFCLPLNKKNKGELGDKISNGTRAGFMRAKTGQRGFTLVEVMIVVAIIGIFAAIALPNFLSWLPNIRLKAAARDLYSNMHKTRTEAVKTNHDWAIVFDTANNRYLMLSLIHI